MRSLPALALLLAPAGPALAQDDPPAELPAEPAPAGGDSSDLAKQLANPVANLISVPLQNNYDCCFGPADGARYTLNIQPVIPISIGKDWNMIVRTIVPVIVQEETVPGEGNYSGLGDTVQSFFFSPKEVKNGLVWAVGPVFAYPTGASRLGSKKWSAGPTALILKQAKGGVTAGILANHLWSVAGEDSRAEVSSTLLQPFFSKTLPDSTTFAINTETTYDWKREQWTVPINLTVSHIFNFGKQKVQIGPTAKYYVESPEGGARWGARLTVTLLFPG